MKKIIAVMLVVVLIVGGLGAFAYANNNSDEPMTGQKLVGSGAYASFPLEVNGTHDFIGRRSLLQIPTGSVKSPLTRYSYSTTWANSYMRVTFSRSAMEHHRAG